MSITKSKDYDYIFKIVLIGDTCVGKCCILVRFSDDIFNDSYVTTIGVDFRFKTMVVNNKVAKIQYGIQLVKKDIVQLQLHIIVVQLLLLFVVIVLIKKVLII